VRDGGGDRAEADPFDHAEPEAELEDVVRELLPAEVGLRAVQDEEVAARRLATMQLQRRPDETGQRAVDHIQRGTS